MITAEANRSIKLVKVEMDGDKKTLESELIAVMMKALEDFTLEELIEDLEIANEQRGLERYKAKAN